MPVSDPHRTARTSSKRAAQPAGGEGTICGEIIRACAGQAAELCVIPFRPTMSSRHEETALFRSNWSLYDAISEQNYMFHREIFELVGHELQSRQRPGGSTILDLGCGNA